MPYSKMSYNAKKLIKKATANLTKDAMKLQAFAMQRYNLKPPPKPTFTKLEQIKEIEQKRQFQSVLPHFKEYPPPETWAYLEKKAIKKHENNCIICFEVLALSDVLIASCGHFYHKSCIEHTKTRTCPCCQQQVYFQISPALHSFSVEFCVIILQKLSRNYLARKKSNARKIIKNGAFQSSVCDVVTASERLTKDVGRQLEIEYFRAKNDADETDRLFDELMKMRDIKGHDVIEKARQRKNWNCAVCLEEIPVKILLSDENGEYAVSSCCGSLFHWDCICAAERENEMCPYCRGGFYKMRVNIED